jgi:hypothetical protein
MQTKRVLNKLDLNQVEPCGWLKNQLQLQMNGLSGRLYDVWDDVGSYSGWLGGTGDAWERAPYWLDGLLPLSWYLKDEKRLILCKRFVDWSLESQQKDGNFGPEATKIDYWSRYIMLKVLIQWYEITADERVLPFMVKYFRYVVKTIDKNILTGWSKARVPDLLYSIKWALEHGADDVILQYAKKIDTLSYDWVDFLSDLPFNRPTEIYINWKKMLNLNCDKIDEYVPFHATHIVNVAMGLKHPAMREAIFGTNLGFEVLDNGLRSLKKFHGVVSGCINGDEHLAGADPNRGSELCFVVEAMFSMMASIEVFGDISLADYLERLAYNALPATITEDFMGHQYLQQANQVMCTYDEKRPWFNNGPDSNLFGLEPNFGCCTANMHQGWPKLLNALWFTEGADTLVSVILAPSSVSVSLTGEKFNVQLETEYPFRETLRYHIRKAPKNEVALKIRIPSWCSKPRLNGEDVIPQNGFINIRRIFDAGETIEVKLPMEVRTSRWFNNSIAVERGPLVFGLSIKEDWRPYRQVAGITDYEVLPKSPWNYAIEEHLSAKIVEQPITKVPFAKNNAPVKLYTKAKKLETWEIKDGNAQTLPQSPVCCDTVEETIELLPMGCTKLRISEFPYYKD